MKICYAGQYLQQAATTKADIVVVLCNPTNSSMYGVLFKIYPASALQILARALLYQP